MRFKIAAIAALLLLCYSDVLSGMASQWATDEDMGHGFLVPLAIAWIVWRERDHWQRIPADPSSWGYLLLAAGALLQLAGAVGTGLFAGSVGFLFSAVGAIVALGGLARTRAWAFPILLSLFMLPKLAILYNQGTLPLQLLATRLAAGMLSLGGVGVVREGNILAVGSHRVAVVEACNGLRYLLPLSFASVVFAYLADRRPWMRIVLGVAAIPIAILANGFRVAASAYVPALAEGTSHSVAGWTIFTLCLGVVFLVHRFCSTPETRHA